MTTVNGEKLIKSIYATLMRDSRINISALQLGIWIRQGRLVLEGSVENILAKRIVANLALETADDAYQVEDHLKVKTRDVDDAILGRKIDAVLSDEQAFSRYQIVVEVGDGGDLWQGPSLSLPAIRVGVDDGVVTLSGTALSISHWCLAEVLIWWIPGCQCIENHIQVLSSAGDSDNELNDAVKTVFEKDPLVDASRISVGTAAGVVELEGRLTSEDEHVVALLDAWTVPGVWEVYDRIEVARSC